LYEDYKQQKLAYIYAPEKINYDSMDIARGYLREILKINLKSFDINLPIATNNDTAYNNIRRIEIWAMNQNDSSIASIESNFYNSYLEPQIEFRANPAKYKMLTQVLPGNHVQMDVLEPVKKIFVLAIM
jgi:hypothetical protein